MKLLTTLPVATEVVPEQTLTPHHLTADLKIILHTDIARSLFNGKWRKGAMGLTQFAQLMKPIWQAATHDDPYAEWYLIKTYTAIEKALANLDAFEQGLQQQLESQRGFELSLFRHPQPLKQPLRFATPFAHMGARLLEKVDYINCLLYTLKKIGLAARDNIRIRHIIEEIQTVFSLAMEWRYFGITRDDVRHQNPLAQQAEKHYGVLPKSVLNKEIKLSILPRLRAVKKEKVN